MEGMREGSLVVCRCREAGAGTDLGVLRFDGKGVLSTVVGDRPFPCECRACCGERFILPDARRGDPSRKGKKLGSEYQRISTNSLEDFTQSLTLTCET